MTAIFTAFMIMLMVLVLFSPFWLPIVWPMIAKRRMERQQARKFADEVERYLSDLKG